MLKRRAIKRDLLFKGRPGDPRIGEWVKPIEALSELTPDIPAIIILGCPDDLGVHYNRGRRGAKDGPESIRRFFYKMAMPMDLSWEEHIQLYDLGDIETSEDILETHARVKSIAKEIAATGATLCLLGGGHDFAAPGVGGFVEGLGHSMGLLNVDPHLDVREWENEKPHSGTPFRTLIEEGNVDPNSFIEFGVRANRNAKTHFQYCQQKKVTVHTLETLRRTDTSIESLFDKHFSSLKTKTVGLTIDIDSCSEGEGMSASPVLGFSAWELYEFASTAGKNIKTRYFEIAEVAPNLDPHERTSRIAAELLYGFIRERSITIGS